ncbi:zinc ribbon domain-containing protein [Streptomyces sp. NRRL B-24572]|uniref:zinc ribbon domain-containing protein n=1 Tax=Streptomyces sp. NRRL B-24572 TaxID=1962156 RepID=UPI000A39D5AA|nr:zinc ribbon domain-containing protein [Streptomyces sp. NRRL B-24572]
MAKAVQAMIGEHPILCPMCDSDTFRKREVKLNSTGMELFDLAWANESATGLICRSCGYVHLFVNRDLRFHRFRG